MSLTDVTISPLLSSLERGVLTLTMNRPEKLNGWTMEMMSAFKSAFLDAERNEEVKVIIFTGIGRYYCAGVNLGATLKLGHPARLRAQIIEHNQALFDAFLDLTKPIIIAINGPAIGASVTSATLCDATIAAENATFSTPFARLGIPPEGCSSVMFARLMGTTEAQRMLNQEGWVPSAAEALQCGLVDQVVANDQLWIAAQALAQQWIDEGRDRRFRTYDSSTQGRKELKAVNAQESALLADAFLASPFILGQCKFLLSKRKYIPAAVFGGMWLTRPLWSRFL